MLKSLLAVGGVFFEDEMGFVLTTDDAGAIVGVKFILPLPG